MELWKTDGTDAGTVMIKDIFPGIGSGEPGGYVGRADGVVFFIATEPSTGYELWRTDGTEAGTRLVKDINPGQQNSIPTYLTVVGNKVYFFADDGVHGNELWVSDGTEAGTSLVTDLNPGKAGQSPKGMAATGNGSLLFYGTDNVNTGLWKSTGAAGNATLLKSNLYARQLTPFDNRVFLTDMGGLLWVSDGTVPGTMMVQSTNSSVDQLVVSGGALISTVRRGRGWGCSGSAPGRPP